MKRFIECQIEEYIHSREEFNNIEKEEKLLKDAKKKMEIIYKRQRLKLTPDLRQWRTRELQNEILYLIKLLSTSEDKINILVGI